MRHSPRAVFLDVDGTLLSMGEGPYAEDVAQIEEARKQGHQVFLCTGRSMAHIPPDLRKSPWIDGIVAAGGAHIMLGDKLVYHTWVPETALLSISAFYLASGRCCILEGETEVYVINWNMKRNFPHETIQAADDFRTKYSRALISKVTFDGGGFSDAERNFLDETFQLFAFEHYSEGFIKGQSKSRGMANMLNAIGIPRENSIAIGDSANDLDMIRFAGLGIAMGNASDDLKAIAGAITTNCGQGGVGTAIKQYVIGTDSGR